MQLRRCAFDGVTQDFSNQTHMVGDDRRPLHHPHLYHRDLLLFPRQSSVQTRIRIARTGQKDERDVTAQQRRPRRRLGRDQGRQSGHPQRGPVDHGLDSVRRHPHGEQLGRQCRHHTLRAPTAPSSTRYRTGNAARYCYFHSFSLLHYFYLLALCTHEPMT